MRTFRTTALRSLCLLGAVSLGACASATEDGETEPSAEVTATTSAALDYSTAEIAAADFDGDGKADFALKTSAGDVLIDYAHDGFHGWDMGYDSYGFSDAHFVPADHDGDGKADLAVKTNGGAWYIDHSWTDYLGWDWYKGGYGNASAHPVPADYDGDGRADLAVKTDDGYWLIDYASTGFGTWDRELANYGGADAIPVPADYDGDGKTDLSVRTGLGNWYIDYASNGFNGWDFRGARRGPASTRPVPADYDGDGKADLAVKTDGGEWLVDLAANGFSRWDRTYAGYGFANARPVPADYDGDGKANLAVEAGGYLHIDYSSSGIGAWDHIVLLPSTDAPAGCGAWEPLASGPVSAAAAPAVGAPSNPSALPRWARSCATSRFFVETKPGVACANQSATGGTWAAAEVFPGVPGTLCQYTWQGTAAPAYAALEAIAGTFDDVQDGRVVRDVPHIRQDCRAQSATCTPGSAGCGWSAATEQRSCVQPEGPGTTGAPQGVPICDACAAAFSGKMNVVLPASQVRNVSRTFIAATRDPGLSLGSVQVQFTVPANTQLLTVPNVPFQNGTLGYLAPKF